MPPDRPAPAPGLGHAQIADHNSRTILEALRRNGPMTRVELAALTGLTAPGVTNVTRRHLADGLIVEGQRRTQNAQVPSAEYALRPDGAFSIGMRFRAGAVEAVLVDLGGAVHARRFRPSAGVEAAAEVVDALAAEAGEAANLIGIGLAVDNYDGPILQALRAALPGRLVVAELDTVAAVLAERQVGAGVPDSGMVMVLLEERIRAGLFLHSIPFAGVHGRAGRIGDMRTGRDRQPLNAVCCAAAFAAAGDRGAEAVEAWIAAAAEHLLDALTAIAGFVAPGKIVLAGDLPADVMQALIDAMRRNWESQTPESPPPPLPPVAVASFPGDSVLLGAALLPFFEMLLPKPFPAEMSAERARRG